jgi:hypothetical protein
MNTDEAYGARLGKLFLAEATEVTEKKTLCVLSELCERKKINRTID